MIIADELNTSAAVRHGFFGRTGGVSKGIYASRNCGLGSDDKREHVIENRRRITEALGMAPDRLCTLYQIHSANVLSVVHPEDAQGQHADAMVTDVPGIALGVMAADCAPILFADHERRIVGAAHAGWKGALAGVAEATVTAMTDLGARRDRISAVIGPCIAQASYEVGPEFQERFVAADNRNVAYFRPSSRSGHVMFDLPGYLLDRLTRIGLMSARWTGHDTCADDTQFFSYRRSVLQSEPDYGRQVAVIGLADDG